MINTLKKILYLLPAKDKVKLLLLLVLMIIGAALEVVGIGMIPVFVSIIATPERVLELEMAQPLLNFLNVTGGGDLLIIGSIVLITVFFLKNLYMVGYYYLEARYIHNRYSLIGSDLYKCYMQAPYTFHLSRNSSELLRNITHETRYLLNFVMKPSMVVITNIVLITAIVVFLMLIEPVITVFAIVFLGIVGFTFLRLLKKKMRSFGKQAQKDRQLMIQDVQEGVGGIKDLSVLNRTATFIKRFGINIKSYARSQAFTTVASRSGKPVMETLAVGGMLLIATILYLQGRELDIVIPILTLFAAATIRLLPATQELISKINSMRYYIYSLEPIYQDIRRLRKNSAAQCFDGSIEYKGWMELTFNKVSYAYPNSSEQAVKHLSITIPRGTAVGFVGSSGAGKTTVVDILLGLLEPMEGGVEVGGKSIFKNLPVWQKKVGYIPQNIFLADDTLRKNIAFGLEDNEIDADLINEAIEASQLTNLVESLDKGLDTVIGEAGVRLSGGQRQRIGIARALYHKPEILIMDEATAALDNITEKYIIEAIERLKGERTVIMIAHRLSTVQNCDKLYFMKNGEITESGTFDELLETSKEFQMMNWME